MNEQLISVAAAVGGLFVGPLLVSLFGARGHWYRVLDAYVVTAIGGLGIAHLLPHSLVEGGALAAAAAALGVFIPLFFEKRAARVQGLTVLVVLLGLALHTVLDGAILGLESARQTLSHSHDGTHGHAHAESLAWAVVLHRLPVGLLLFTLVARRSSRRFALVTLGVLGLTTVLGFFAAESVLSTMPQEGIAIFEAFVVGALLHVIVHMSAPSTSPATRSHGHGHGHGDGDRHGHGHGDGDRHEHGHGHGEPEISTRGRWLTAIGALLGLATVVLLNESPLSTLQTPSELAAGHAFLTLALESAPALLIAYVLAGLIGSTILPKSGQWLSRGGRLTQAGKGLAFGLPLPICSCSVLPFYETLVRRGVPGTAAVAFLIATPELGIDALLISLPLLGTTLTMTRLVGAAVVAVVSAYVIGKLLGTREPSVVESVRPTAPLRTRLRDGLRFGLVELVDHTLPWVLLGLGIAAMAEPLFSPDALSHLPSALQVPLFAVIGIPLYVCASGATPLAAVAIHKGVSAGAALAFLLTGPATNATTFGVLSRLHGKRAALAFGVLVSGLAIATGWAVDAFVPTSPADLHLQASEQPSLFEWASLGGLTLLLLGSLFRQGPRGMLQQLFNPVHVHEPAEGDACTTTRVTSA